MARGEYALQACDYCGVQLYANELIPITDRTRSGERRGSRSYLSSRGTIGHGSSRSDYYRIDHLKVCRNCYDARAAAISRERRGKFIGGVLMIGVIGGGIAFIAEQPGSTASNSAQANAVDPEAGNATNMDQADNLADASAPPLTPQADSNTVDAAPAPSRDEPQASPQEPPRYDQPQHTEGYQGPSAGSEIADAIKEATPEALEAGKPQMWRAAGSKGYVVPSSPQDYGGQTCANVYATKFYGEQQSQSAAVRWCKASDGGDWHLAPVETGEPARL